MSGIELMDPKDAWLEPIKRRAAQVQAEAEAIRLENERLRARLGELVAARLERCYRSN